jgi:thiol peroxidase
MTQERAGYTFKGNPIHLLGSELKVGDQAPDVSFSTSFVDHVQLSSFDGKIKFISVTPSLDTGKCDIQARRFNQEASALGDQVAIINVSVDLPPAQARWCGASGADQITVLSDYKHKEFGLKYGVLIKELQVDMRAVFIVDKSNKIQYIEVLREMAEEPNYDAAIAAAKKLIQA